MMTISFTDGEDDATLGCEFCGPIDLPEQILMQGNRTNPTGEDIIRSHYGPHTPAIDDDTNGVEPCANWSKWKTTTWESRELSADRSVEWGTVTVRRNGTIEVVTTGRSD